MYEALSYLMHMYAEYYGEGSFLAQCLKLFGSVDGQLVWEVVNTFFDTLPLAGDGFVSILEV